MARIFMILLSLFLCQSGKSQQKFEYGIQAGLNLNSARINSSPDFRQGILAGFNIGTQLKFNFTKYFGIKAMLQYDQKGFMYKNLTVEYPGNTVGKANILTRLNYIDLKLLPIVTVGQMREFYLYAGPSVGVLVGNKFITKFQDSLPAGHSNTVSSDGDDRKPLNFGVAFGVGTQIPVARKIRIGFDFRSDIGLSNVLKNGEARLSTFSFTPGILFSL